MGALDPWRAFLGVWGDDIDLLGSNGQDEPWILSWLAPTVSVREMILRGRLKPGQRVTEIMLAQLLGMSRTPVRQALPVLAREGLLVESGTPRLPGAHLHAQRHPRCHRSARRPGGLRRPAHRRARGSAALLQQLRECLEEGDGIFRKRHLVDSDEAAYGP